MTLSSLEYCDCCHDLFPLRKIIFTGKQFLCVRCAKEGDGKEE
jgi:hypothetical protein